MQEQGAGGCGALRSTTMRIHAFALHCTAPHSLLVPCKARRQESQR